MFTVLAAKNFDYEDGEPEWKYISQEWATIEEARADLLTVMDYPIFQIEDANGNIVH